MADPLPNGVAGNGDVEMKDDGQAQASPSAAQPMPQSSFPDPTPPTPSPAQPPPVASHSAPTPPPATRPSSIPPPPPARPDKPVAHGGPTRQYLNQTITPHLLEAMKFLAVHEPEKPLLWLSDFLKERSKEIEG